MITSKQSPSCGVMILAAGFGKRMRSSLPKCLHEISGKPLLYYVLRAVQESAPGACVGIVVGFGRESVEAYVRQEIRFQGMDISFIVQAHPQGTGHAAQAAMESLWGKKCTQQELPILVLPGDMPLISAELLAAMICPLPKTVCLRLLTTHLDNPTGYGRVVRVNKNGAVMRIVEERDASTAIRSLHEVATSIYFYHVGYLNWALDHISDKNSQNEYYLTDTVELVKKFAKSSDKKRPNQADRNSHYKKLETLIWKNVDDLRGVNDLWELTQAEEMMNFRIVKNWALRGVRFFDPSHVRIEESVEIGEKVEIHSRVMLCGVTQLGANTVVESGVILKNVQVGSGVHLKAGTLAEDSEIGADCKIGPYAHLRPGCSVGNSVKIGNFVELKKSNVGDHSSVAHLSYLGDAVVGKNVNIGCGFVTCNFDGRIIAGQRKHRTVIEDDVFLGSDCQTVAPLTIGKGAYVASGSTITQNVPPHSLAIARSRQIIKPGYAAKLREKAD